MGGESAERRSEKSTRRRQRNGRVCVLIADGHPGFRLALQDAVRSWPEFDVCGVEEANGELYELVARDDPDVLIADPCTLGLEAVELLERFAGERPRVVLIAHSPTPAQLRAAVDGGAAGFLAKDSPPREVCDTVLAVARGENRVGGQSAGRAWATAIRLRSSVPGSGLSERERGVVRGVAQGMTNDQIAAELFISRGTVKRHLQQLMLRFEARTRGQLIYKLGALGLLD
jgi:DNA-binding NarL/FixJ family response regulator